MEINWISILMGVSAIVFGFYTLNMRKNNPEKFIKLEPMKGFWGEKRGELMHKTVYTFLPFIFGVLLLLKGFLGR